MKIITTHINKGGTGKSTISYNFASWIAERKNKKAGKRQRDIQRRY